MVSKGAKVPGSGSEKCDVFYQMQECLPHPVEWKGKELEVLAWKITEGIWLKSIINIAENVIREGLGSVFHNPVELLGLKQIKVSFFCAVHNQNRVGYSGSEK